MTKAIEIEQAVSPPHDYSSFFRVWQDLGLYPALRLLYGVGTASALTQNWGLLRILAREVEVVDTSVYRPCPAGYVLDGGGTSRATCCVRIARRWCSPIRPTTCR